ncbi:MAG: hypothetical protein J5836_01365 [Clostridia bacterium]|nr:hypothetical protein [Clostridia bacterium]
MDFLFELIFTLIFYGAVDIAKNKKISKWIRYPVAAILTLFILGVFTAVGIAGVSIIADGKIFLGIVVTALDLLLIVAAIIIVVTIIKNKRNSL